MLKGIVLTLTLAFLTMGLCGCAEKQDAAEELEEFTLEGESDVEKNSSNSKTESEKGSQGGTDAEEGLPDVMQCLPTKDLMSICKVYTTRFTESSFPKWNVR